MEGNLLSTYSKQIKLLFTQLTTLTNWHFDGKVGKFNTFSCGPYVKSECILDCSSLARFSTALGDTSIVTREQWDEEFFRLPNQGSGKTLTRLCMFEQDIELINWEHSLRIQWKRITEKETLIVQSTSMHPVYKSSPTARHNDSLFLLKQLENEQIHLTYIGLIDVSKMILQCEALVSNVARFHQIYDAWKCPNCSQVVPAHELECRNCKLERYRRCPDKKCYREQRAKATMCEACGLKL